jgi:hypothetical protein
MSAISRRDFAAGLGGITLAFTLAPPAPSCAKSLTAACFKWFQRVGRVTGPRALEQWGVT